MQENVALYEKRGEKNEEVEEKRRNFKMNE